jgi:hypothetical protein
MNKIIETVELFPDTGIVYEFRHISAPGWPYDKVVTFVFVGQRSIHSFETYTLSTKYVEYCQVLSVYRQWYKQGKIFVRLSEREEFEYLLRRDISRYDELYDIEQRFHRLSLLIYSLNLTKTDVGCITENGHVLDYIGYTARRYMQEL